MTVNFSRQKNIQSLTSLKEYETINVYTGGKGKNVLIISFLTASMVENHTSKVLLLLFMVTVTY